MEEVLFLIQDRLNKRLLNTYIEDDEYGYNLLVDCALTIITSYQSYTKFSKEPLFLQFNETCISFQSNVILNNIPESLHVYLEIKNNIITNIEAFILEWLPSYPIGFLS